MQAGRLVTKGLRSSETVSDLPLLSAARITKQVDRIVAKILHFYLEFAAPLSSLIANDKIMPSSDTVLSCSVRLNWTLCKLPNLPVLD